MSVGAPKGNKNAKKAKIWTAAIERALEKRSKESFQELDRCAEALIDQCLKGDMTALKELGDRLEGKPAVTVASDPENPFVMVTKITIAPLNDGSED